MENSTNLDIPFVAKNLDLPEPQVRAAIQLLADGNTIPFITRYRKDETQGLAERQLRSIKLEVARLNALSERKASILKSIENQDRLTDQLRSQIEQTNQSRQLEDLYLPFKPKKTSLAETARQQGLEPLSRDILEGLQPDVDLASRATDFVRVDKGLTSIDEVIKGVKHILAERFAEHLKLRKRLRKLYWESAKIQTGFIAPAPANEASKTESGQKEPVTESKETTPLASTAASNASPAGSPSTQATDATTESPVSVAPSSELPSSEKVAESIAVGDEASSATPEATPAEPKPESEPKSDSPEVTSEALPHQTSDSTKTDASGKTDEATVAAVASDPPAAATAAATGEPPAPDVAASSESVKPKKKRKKKKKKKSRPDPFSEFENFEESLQKLPPHRTLAINRGERASKLKVRLHAQAESLNSIARETLVPAEHPFAEFLTSVCDDAMSRLILPGIEREIRRDLTERAETHAVNVFARNLRHLFLQPPVRGKRIMGIDPGYRSGCKVAVIDETGQPLGHGVFSIVGNEERINNNKQRLIDLINTHQPNLIAIGNGSGCRAVEQFVSDVISGTLADRNLQYSIVNQAGTSTYSTSEVGQQDLPDHDPVIRSAISIARRLQDPLSELVKVNPANIGVGMYQHDIKAKHLAESLENVVESSVNFVGVNANTASISLLKHISGLGQTTARKLVEHRNSNGPFESRDRLKQVSGLGDITYVQSAGFLRIENRENQLDSTSIHPDDYPVAEKLLQKLGCTIDELIVVRRPEPGPPAAVSTSPAENVAPPENAAAPASEQKSDSPENGKSTNAEEAQANTSAGESATTETSETSDETAAALPVATPPVATPATSETPAPATVETPATESAATETIAAPAEAVVAVEAAPAAPSPEELAEKRKRRQELIQQIKNLNPAELATELGVGEMKIRDILRSIRNPHQDPREDLPAPVFRKGILKFDDLKSGMQLRGQIVNVVDFGVFLNIGIGESCLVHISRLANRFVRDPHWFYAVGDVLNVWVQAIDSEKRRVTLTAIRPESAKPQGHGRKQRSESSHSEGGGRSRQSSQRRGNAASKGGGTGRGKRHNKSHSGNQGSGRSKSYERRPPRKPKPVTPITEEMVDGKKPMRSFSDLLQFHQKKKKDDGDE